MSDSVSKDRGPVVVTGTSTGIGAATAIHLAENGFRVFAGVRRDEDGEALQAQTSEELTPFEIDISDEASISAAASSVTSTVGERGLAGLVNNAGIVKPAPLEFQPLADFREQLEVNLVGHLAVTQAFMPLIRLAAGESSTSGRSAVAWSCPSTAPTARPSSAWRRLPTRFGSSCASGRSPSR